MGGWGDVLGLGAGQPGVDRAPVRIGRGGEGGGLSPSGMHHRSGQLGYWAAFPVLMIETKQERYFKHHQTWVSHPRRDAQERYTRSILSSDTPTHRHTTHRAMEAGFEDWMYLEMGKKSADVAARARECQRQVDMIITPVS